MRPRSQGRCHSGKIRWIDGYNAQLALDCAQKLRRETGAEKVEKRIYECPICKGWHLTSHEQKTEVNPTPKKPLILEVR